MSYETVKKLANEAFESTKSLNNIVELLEFCKSNEPIVSHFAITSLAHIFKKTIPIHKDNVYEWLRENSIIYFDILHADFDHSDIRIQVTSFEKSLEIVKLLSEKCNEFQNKLYLKIVAKFLLMRRMSEQLFESLTTNLNEFDDLRYYFYKNTAKLCKKTGKEQINTELVFKILSSLRSTPVEGEVKMICETSLCGPLEDKSNAVTNLRLFQRAFGECWVSFLTLPMAAPVYSSILEVLHQKVMVHMSDPRSLMDFLVDAYNSGGFVSILALNGLFILITEFNLDYPNFYAKLYYLFDKNIMHAKYRSRFFRLAGLFLSSAFIPSYLVAAFIKRMARLCLYAPPTAIVIVLPLMYNLLRLHPACITLIHRTEQISIENDPYNFDEINPDKSNAAESSLWELELIARHYSSVVSGLAKIFQDSFAKPSFDLEDFLDHTYKSMIEAELKSKFVQKGELPALAVLPVPSVFEDNFV